MASQAVIDLVPPEWNQFSDVRSLLTMRTTSAKFRASAHEHLIAAAVLLVRCAEHSPSRKIGIKVFGCLCRETNLDVDDILVTSLADDKVYIQSLALHAVQQLIQRGCSSASFSSLVANRLRSFLPIARQEALLANLISLPEIADAAVVSAVCELLSHPVPGLRAAAVDALKSVVTESTPDIVRAVAACLSDADYEVRYSAIEFLHGVVKRGDQIAVEAVSVYLGHQWDDVHRAAVSLLRGFVDQQSMHIVVSYLNSANPRMRTCILHTLRQLVEEADEATLTAIRARLNDSQEEVRTAALKALGRLSRRGDRTSLGAVLAKLDTSSVDTLAEAVLAIKRLALAGDSQAMKALAGQLKHKDPSYRVLVVQTFGYLLTLEDGPSTLVLRSMLEDESADVRRACLSVMQRLLDIGDESTASVLAVVDRLQDPDDDVRIAAVEAAYSFPVLSKCLCSSALNMMVSFLKQHDSALRGVTLMAIKAIAKKSDLKGHEESISAIRECLTDFRVGVQISALETLEVLTEGNQVPTKSVEFPETAVWNELVRDLVSSMDDQDDV